MVKLFVHEKDAERLKAEGLWDDQRFEVYEKLGEEVLCQVCNSFLKRDTIDSEPYCLNGCLGGADDILHS